jgi:hypothetical protein
MDLSGLEGIISLYCLSYDITRHLSDVLELGQLRYRDMILLTIQCKQIGTSFTYAHGH